MRLRILPVIAIFLCATLKSWAIQTENRGIHAVPAPGQVVIDGKLDDWDRSGEILICYDVQSLRDVYSGRVTMMFDKDALYIAIHWKDPIPMGNSHDPMFQANKGWAGDCVQLRIKTDRISHITAWCYAAKQEPAIHLDYGKSLSEPFGGGSLKLKQIKGWVLDNGAEMAFLKDEDGRGYVQEMLLPWNLIVEKKSYVPGERFQCGIELLWGEADWPVHRYADNLADGATSREFFWTAKDAWGDVLLSPNGNLTLPTSPWEIAVAEKKPEGPIKIEYTLAMDSRVTLAIDDTNGNRVRNLLTAAKRNKGGNCDLWDGLDDKGNIVKPGDYVIKGLSHDGLRLSYAHSFASPGKPGWNTADGKGAFYGDHTSPEAVAMGDNFGALACPMGEAGPHLIGVDLKGQRQWGLANRVSFGGGRISLATDGKILFVANGDPDKQDNPGAFTIWRCDLATGQYAPWNRKDQAGQNILDLVITPNAGTENCRAIAYHKGHIAAIVAKECRIVVLNSQTGDVVKNFTDMPVDMTGLSYESKGSLLLAAGETLYRIDASTGQSKELATELDAPKGVAVDKAGNIYVSQCGKAQNVAVFDSKGNRTGEIGKRGGRQHEGFFQADGMLKPRQIALDKLGHLWVTENTHQPKRTSVWNITDGKLAFDLVGTTAYSAGGIINPFDHTRAISEHVEYKLDFEKQTYRPLFTFSDVLGTGFDHICRIVKVDGREYAQAKGSARHYGLVKLFMRCDDGSWRHVAEFGNVGDGRIDDPGAMNFNRMYRGGFWEGNFGKGYVWCDANSDGKADPSEVQFNDSRFGAYYWGQMIGGDLTIGMPLSDRKNALICKPEFNKGGTPIYKLSKARRVECTVGFSGEGMFMLGRNDCIYLNQTPLTGLDSKGKVKWTYPSDYVSVHGSHRAPAAQPGLLIGPSSFYGSAVVNEQVGEVFYLNGNLGQNFLFTEDGLWVQSIYNDCRGWFDVPSQAIPGMSTDAMTAGGESFYGGFCKSDDNKYYTVGGGTAAIVMEIKGLDSLKRFGAKVQVTDDDIVAAQELKIKLAAKEQATKVYSIRQSQKNLVINGKLDGWDMAKDSIYLQVGSDRIGTIKASYDSKRLYLAYQVRDRSPMKNAGQDERLMFITGDCVDLMLRTDPEAKSGQPVKGDLRLLMTLREDKPLAVLYQPVVPGTKKQDRVEFSSPWRTIYMDKVTTPELSIEVSKSNDGYIVTAAVPLETLGLDSLKGKTLHGDFGILLSDATGRECTSRNYWSNKATNNTNDVPDEAIIAPALWGELRFE